MVLEFCLLLSQSPLIDLDITADFVKHVAYQVQGSAGPDGSTALHWHGYLLQLGLSSACLRDAVAMLAHHLTNGIVEWESICALMVSRLIALDKCSGVRSIGLEMYLDEFFKGCCCGHSR